MSDTYLSWNDHLGTQIISDGKTYGEHTKYSITKVSIKIIKQEIHLNPDKIIISADVFRLRYTI